MPKFQKCFRHGTFRDSREHVLKPDPLVTTRRKPHFFVDTVGLAPLALVGDEQAHHPLPVRYGEMIPGKVGVLPFALQGGKSSQRFKLLQMTIETFGDTLQNRGDQ